ncbi:MAG TPA: hypothetical protein VN883_09980 [Myxococcales bacterium]|jgi:hypothetical protein|nr:hypothetical protein [Myxococcales bacterium]
MADETQEAAKGKGGGAFSRLVLWLLIFALLGVVWWLGSERNARRFTTEVREGRLVVGRGRFFPMGSRFVVPDDGELWKLYQPLQLPAGMKPPPDREYDDQAQLDQGLFSTVVAAARQAAQKSDEAALSQADALAARAGQLPGLSAAQLGELAALRGDLALTTAKGDAATALRLVHAARARLEEARKVSGDRAPQIGAFAAALDEAAAALDGAAERKPRTAPAAAQPAPGPTPPATVPAAAAPDAAPARKAASPAQHH